jgi:hypothetical protein
MFRRSKAAAVTLAAVATLLLLPGAALANPVHGNAAGNASCVAALSSAGDPPGSYQRAAHEPKLGKTDIRVYAQWKPCPAWLLD